MDIDLVGILIPIVVANIITGAIFMLGFIPIVRRAIDKDIPARLASIDGHIEKLGNELLQMRRTVDHHEYRIETLEQSRRGDDLDDSGIRRRRNPRNNPQ
jgi:hypothetical protein